MRKLLVMCPSRGRPKILREMLDSYFYTKSIETDLVIYLNEDDPKLKEYPDNTCIVGPRLYLAEAYNEIFKRHPDYDYYVPINDDHVFITPGWDKKLINIVETKGKGWGLAAAEDRLTNWAEYQHPSGCVISGNIPRTLGYFVWPKIQHIGIDDYFQYLMQGIGRLFHDENIVIEHRHWINGKRPLDENYKWVYNQEQHNYGMRMVKEYLETQYAKDVEKLNEKIKEG
jgi:hypothetical protein